MSLSSGFSSARALEGAIGIIPFAAISHWKEVEHERT
ncbi:hypothetical protein COHCIP112018_00841 [Cohnella sp. JJ-181]|nr:hypothetical protein COHCIP112018_00841 [Cohnella sp. JJ-181]